ncbi:MAG: hypothetical protein HOY75_40185 [Streptomyces sp.]|nr:hypothetical protein [Streptomyces sp.]
MSHAEELRSAATRLRCAANQATPGPWTPADGSIPYGHRVGSADETDWVAWTGAITEDRSEADAAYIATMHPAVGAALADWLDTAAANAAALTWPSDFIDRALAVARAINGGQP